MFVALVNLLPRRAAQMALVLRIKFPLSYPVIYKTLRIDSSLSVRQAIIYVNETLRVNVPVDSVGLFLPHENRWLGDDQVLSTVPELQEAVRFANHASLLFSTRQSCINFASICFHYTFSIC